MGLTACHESCQLTASDQQQFERLAFETLVCKPQEIICNFFNTENLNYIIVVDSHKTFWSCFIVYSSVLRSF